MGWFPIFLIIVYPTHLCRQCLLPLKSWIKSIYFIYFAFSILSTSCHPIGFSKRVPTPLANICSVTCLFILYFVFFLPKNLSKNKIHFKKEWKNWFLYREPGSTHLGQEDWLFMPSMRILGPVTNSNGNKRTSLPSLSISSFFSSNIHFVHACSFNFLVIFAIWLHIHIS